MERSGNLRVNKQTSSLKTEIYTVYVVGVTNGLITVDSNEIVETSYLKTYLTHYIKTITMHVDPLVLLQFLLRLTSLANQVKQVFREWVQD